MVALILLPVVFAGKVAVDSSPYIIIILLSRIMTFYNVLKLLLCSEIFKLILFDLALPQRRPILPTKNT